MENNAYIGKVCPYCKTEFKEGDNIVVCSACDMPHHAECWVENQGCTTFGCQGTIQGVDRSANSVTATNCNFEATAAPRVFCTSCGSAHPAGTAFCTNCGTALTSPRPAPQPNPYNGQNYNAQQNYNFQPGYNTQPNYNTQQSYNTYTAQQSYTQPGYGAYSAELNPTVEGLIGTKRDYYVPKFREMKQQNKMTSWNWAAFLFCGYWLIYRKMYLYGGIYLVAALILGSLGEIGSLLLLAADVALGFFGNWLYMNHLEKGVQQASADPNGASNVLPKYRDVNLTAAILTAVGYCILVIMLL